ncbi:tautomerase family protein [Chitinophaga vietnamensis]|uniref:tautomerase family protein n=1 Tax=Chitinophaga vietnamensis TaxID=2593957 RepID=UPI0011775400|nr:tautomerase family protein [Chitinophaga vietnamensis]
MPFVQVYHGNHFSQSEKKQISLAIHSSLADHFNVPENDYFQVFRQVAPEDFFFPDSFLDVPHTANLLYVHITARAGRTLEKKQALYQAIASRIAAATSVKVEDVIIILVENDLAGWSFGRGQAQYVI